jgi:predicted transcriptional regulator
MMSKPLTILEKAAAKLAPGRAPYFVEAHLVKALMTIDDEGTVGRVKLSKTLGLGEGTIRTLIKHLENEKLIKISKAGIASTSSGKKLATDLKSRISKGIEVPRSSLTVGPFSVAILVKNAADAVRGGVEQRDAAIKIGALGATTLIYRRGKLNMPLVEEEIFRDQPTTHEVMTSKLKPQEDDVIIIGTANDKSTAELGAIAATLETLKTH